MHRLRNHNHPQHCVMIHDAQTNTWLLFDNLIETLTAASAAEIIPLLETVEQRVDRQGCYAAGFLSYEAAAAFDSSLTVQPSHDFPLAWFGIYTQPRITTLPALPNSAAPLLWQPTSPLHYQAAIEQIKHYIAQGHTYQVNFSFRLRSDFTCDPWRYWLQLMQAQASSYGAFINLEDWAICCASPELFFCLSHDSGTAENRTLISRPMKGTAPRGLTADSDRRLAEELRHSTKDQAENVMIVDMIRNDMGRIARTGSVQVIDLFAIEQYPTVWQMTSTVQCSTAANLVEIFQAMFPCASITGAPKPRTMQIIADLEATPRRIYTGTIGYLTPDRCAQFNVAIRTVLIDKANQAAEYGVGGGIVWDSTTDSEFEECCTKAKILFQSQPQFELLESLLWTPAQDYFLLDLHLQRLQASAAYFAFAIDLAAVRDRLNAIAETLLPQSHKVRLRVTKSGDIRLAAEPLSPAPLRLQKVGISQRSIDSSDVFLYHKTTYRAVYDQARQAGSEFDSDYDDVLLWNERGELTESCAANLVVEWNGVWYTPPVQCGLLAGTMRTWLMQQGKLQERVLKLNDLHQCSRIFLINSVRQVQEVAIDRVCQPDTTFSS